MNLPDALTALLRIAATPEEVFPTLSTRVRKVQWIGDWADLHPESGGIFASTSATKPGFTGGIRVGCPNRTRCQSRDIAAAKCRSTSM